MLRFGEDSIEPSECIDCRESKQAGCLLTSEGEFCSGLN